MPEQVFQSIATKEGSVEKIPVNSNDITNKNYVDNLIVTLTVGTLLVTAIVIGGLIKLNEVDGILFINASTKINGSLNVSDNLNVNETLYVIGDKVGIGIIPETLLDVWDSTQSRIQIGRSDAQTAKLVLDYTGTSANIGTFAPDSLNFYTNSTIRIRITDSGKVGIGTISPEGALDVTGGSAIFHTGNIVNPFYITRQESTDIRESLQIFIDDSKVKFHSIQDETSGLGRAGYSFRMGSKAGQEPFFEIIDNRLETDIVLFRLLESGNLGLGTTTPKVKLNVIGGINATGNITGNFIFGETSIHPDGNITIDIETPGVHKNITGFNESELNGFTLQDNALVAEIGGRYKIDYWISSAGGVNNIYESCIAVNGEHVTPHAHRRQGTPGDIGSMSGGGIISLNAGDIVNLQIQNTEGIQDVDIFFAGMRLVRIGD